MDANQSVQTVILLVVVHKVSVWCSRYIEEVMIRRKATENIHMVFYALGRDNGLHPKVFHHKSNFFGKQTITR